MMDGWAGFGACDAPGVPEPTPLERMTAERDAALAEVQRLREALKDTAAQMKLLLDKTRGFGRGHVYTNDAWKLHFRSVVADSDTALAAVDALLTDAARALVSPP